MNPVQAFQATYNGNINVTQSEYATFSFCITQEFEAFVMVEVITPSSYIAGAEIEVYRSTDGSNTWETDGTFKGALPATPGATHRKTFNLETGSYLYTVLAGGGGANTITINALTAYVITAYT